MNPHRMHRLGVIAGLAFAGPMAASALLACTTDDSARVETTAQISNTTTPPNALRWQSFQGVELPVSEQGPHQIDGAVAIGYERSPAGAAVAAIQATVRASIATDGEWPQIGARMLAPGSARDGWAVARAQISITEPVSGKPPKILGYIITGYSPDAADLDIYTLYSDGSLTSNHAEVVWQAEDWLLALPETPGEQPTVRAIASAPADLVPLLPR